MVRNCICSFASTYKNSSSLSAGDCPVQGLNSSVLQQGRGHRPALLQAQTGAWASVLYIILEFRGGFCACTSLTAVSDPGQH